MFAMSREVRPGRDSAVFIPAVERAITYTGARLLLVMGTRHTASSAHTVSSEVQTVICLSCRWCRSSPRT